MRAPAIVAVLLVSGAASAEGLKISGAEFDTYVKLFNARALSEARRMYAGADMAKKAQAEADYRKAVEDAGWTAEKLDEVGRELEAIRVALGDVASDKDNNEDYRKSLAEDHDAATVALLQKRQGELNESAARQRAEAQARAEKNQAAAGRAPSSAELQGKWKFDLDATIEHMGETMGLDAASLKPVRDQLARNGETTWSFSGKNIEQRTVKPGVAPQVIKGTFRVAGNDLIINDGQRDDTIQVGLKSAKELIFSLMGVGSIYRKQ